ncbi:lipoate--protein ligase [Mycoplasma iguanae]|uniref:lipoate--protein ligase n=1 Tax=Mycoplasma iguanae TaxID=292461 RepID=A0ABY5R8F9_9MOLU|nr:lipoate--protein ligase [Mycoplasma iguanae]UVD81452.1 lipoate--protein ligase [Mycoplasma iguanae]
MKIYLSKTHTPYFNLVLEEIILKDPDLDEDVIMLYQHSNAVIIGRNQNTHQEVKIDAVKRDNVEIARRLSGGGAVYHDLGNINFSFITNKNDHGYEKFLGPIIEFLKTLGLDARFKGRNDLEVNGAKVSGNAQYIYKNRMFHHGTILFNANLAKLGEYLVPSKLKIVSKGIESIRQRVTNIIDELETKITSEEFLNKLVDFLIQKYNAQYLEIKDDYLKQIPIIAELRQSEAWIYGSNPPFNFSNIAKFDKGILQVKVEVEKNVIKNINFEGDFLSRKDTSEIVDLFIGVAYDKDKISSILDKINLDDYFGGIDKEEILKLLFE